MNNPDPTRYIFPELWSASHTDHIANLERVLLKKKGSLEKAIADVQLFQAELAAWRQCGTDSTCTRVNLLRGTICLTAEHALHYICAQGWHSPEEWSELQELLTRVRREMKEFIDLGNEREQTLRVELNHQRSQEREVRSALVKLLGWCKDTGVFLDPDLMDSIRDLANP